MDALLLVTLTILVITTAYVLQMSGRDYGFPEGYANYEKEVVMFEPVATGPDLADATQGLLLADMLKPSKGVTKTTARGCAEEDSERQTELGGQYVQRTNNYRRKYPDNCSSPLSEFVGAFYEPKQGAVGSVVPCNGSC